jgi:GNAT superfamily N-acetyltransferase
MPAYEVTTDPAHLDCGAIHAFLSTTYWSTGIPRATVEDAIKNSVCVGAFLESQQVGFARAVTDKATFAYLADVYVLEAHRGNGLSARMLQALFGLPELQGLRRMLLVTRDAHALYAKFGFTPLAAPDRFMERHVPHAYVNKRGAA